MSDEQVVPTTNPPIEREPGSSNSRTPIENTPMPDLAEYMPTTEAAEKLGFTLPGIHHLIRKSKIEAVRVGRVYLVSRKSVQEYFDKTQGVEKNNPTRGKDQEDH